ncbi:MFS general substrate transporter [Laetiporus sulphureus 93-53]|uniref:MFS general substrate transporter n=1 Tax=Laetiporus sulphureus 93-53 TaxID=1314785 RepID=A0A165DLD6_9APHY|nr:MFS general substrate transporter [Laetiporus sulphureus 93-53]KZT05139.1 MFS general substrate transporter [Laetiporus sulphureus 93-53]
MPDEQITFEEKASHREQSQENDTQSPTPVVDVEKSAPPANQIVIPDGGFQAWMSIVGGWLVSFCTFGFASSFGVFEDYYVQHSTETSSNISWIGSLMLFFLFTMGLPAGKLFDMGYFHHLIAFGSLLLVFCMMMLSLADVTHYYELILAQGIGIGLGAGCLLVPALSAQSHHWRRRRSFAMGLVLTGSSVGGIIYPIMLNQLFNNGVGFAWGVRAAAFMTLGLLVIANFALTTRLPSRRDRKRLGLPEPDHKPKISSVLTDPPYIIANIGAFLGLWGVFLPYFYLQLFVNAHGLSKNLAFYSISILNAASIIGRTVPNALSDRFGAFNTLTPVSLIIGGLLWVMFGATTPGGVIVFSILYGAFSGGFISLLPPTFASMAKHPEEIGVRIGFGYCFSALALLTGTPIDGALLGSHDAWAKPIIFSGVVILAGTACLATARMIVTKQKGTWKA